MSTSSISADPWKYFSTLGPIYEVECIGEYSLDKDENLKLGREEAKYIYKEMIGKHVEINMVEGMNEQEKRSIESLDNIFRWLMETAAPNSILKDAVDDCEFVCRRGPLLRITVAPYANLNNYDGGQQLFCTKYKGVYFIRDNSEGYKETKEKFNKFQRKMSYVSHKFEQIMTSSDPNKPPNANERVDPNADFNGIFKATLTYEKRPLNILCTALVDGILNKDGKKEEFVELKTQIKEMGHGNNFASKAINWYFQSYLIGIKRFVVGYLYDKDKNDTFFLNRVDYFPLDRLLKVCGGTKCPWNVDVCLNFLHAFLEKIKSDLDALPEETILVAERPDNGIEFQFISIGKDHKDYANYEFISKEFKAHGWKEEE